MFLVCARNCSFHFARFSSLTQPITFPKFPRCVIKSGRTTQNVELKIEVQLLLNKKRLRMTVSVCLSEEHHPVFSQFSMWTNVSTTISYQWMRTIHLNECISFHREEHFSSCSGHSISDLFLAQEILLHFQIIENENCDFSILRIVLVFTAVIPGIPIPCIPDMKTNGKVGKLNSCNAAKSAREVKYDCDAEPLKHTLPSPIVCCVCVLFENWLIDTEPFEWNTNLITKNIWISILCSAYTLHTQPFGFYRVGNKKCGRYA